MENPTLIQLESSTACDARCVFCPRSSMRRLNGSMPTAMFEQIVAQTLEMGVGEILLFLNGEPLLFPPLFDWLQILRKAGLKTTLFTNAYSLTEEKAFQLASFSDVVIAIVFSLGGMDKPTFEDVMGIDFLTVAQNVIRFRTINAGAIPTIGHIPRMSVTEQFLGEWVTFWEPKVDEVSATAMFNFAGAIKDDLELAEDEHHRRQYCGRLDHIAILFDGSVALCCMDVEGKVILGNVEDDTLIDIFNSETALHYRDLHRQGKYAELPLCQDCNMNILRMPDDEAIGSDGSL